MGVTAPDRDALVAGGRRLDRTLSALADPRRRRVLELLRERPRTAGDLARSVGVAAPAMSRHLRALRASGLVAESHPDFDARLRIYALTPAPMGELIDWLNETERMWRGQLAAFKARVEGAAPCGDTA